MSDVPDELLLEILSRLPVAPLLRFRCVSKSWKSLIDSHQFINHHLDHSRRTNSDLNIVFESHTLYSADVDLLNETNMATFKKLSPPLSETGILGACDGLLVLRNYEHDITILWNPSVSRFHVIPSTGIQAPTPGCYKRSFDGFGYDVVNDDYKLIIIAPLNAMDSEFSLQVKVYSLKFDFWRRIQDFPYHIDRMSDCMRTEGVLANGALHWIITGKVKPDSDDLVAAKEGYLVGAFDLGTEEYRLVPLPKFAYDDDTPPFEVLVLGGCLSLMCYEYDGDKGRYSIWVMKEYGVQESWSILFTIDRCGFQYLKVIACSKCGRKVLLGLDGKVLVWYDLDKKSTGEPMFQMPLEDLVDNYTCLRSLLLLNNGTRDFDLVAKKKQESRMKNHSEQLFESESESESESSW